MATHWSECRCFPFLSEIFLGWRLTLAFDMLRVWHHAHDGFAPRVTRLMDKILHDLKDSKLWELWYIPYNG